MSSREPRRTEADVKLTWSDALHFELAVAGFFGVDHEGGRLLGDEAFGLHALSGGPHAGGVEG